LRASSVEERATCADKGKQDEKVNGEKDQPNNDENFLNEEKFLLKVEGLFKQLWIGFVGVARKFVGGIFQAQSADNLRNANKCANDGKTNERADDDVIPSQKSHIA
jgi:hypothetical protein